MVGRLVEQQEVRLSEQRASRARSASASRRRSVSVGRSEVDRRKPRAPQHGRRLRLERCKRNASRVENRDHHADRRSAWKQCRVVFASTESEGRARGGSRARASLASSSPSSWRKVAGRRWPLSEETDRPGRCRGPILRAEYTDKWGGRRRASGCRPGIRTRQSRRQSGVEQAWPSPAPFGPHGQTRALARGDLLASHPDLFEQHAAARTTLRELSTA